MANLLESLNDYIIEAKTKEFVGGVEKFLLDNPSPVKSQINAFCDATGAKPEELDEYMWKLAGKFIEFMKSGESNKRDNAVSDVSGVPTVVDNIDPAQLKKGTSVEKEHTGNAEIATKIARDHLVEIPDYYTRLAMMEETAKAELTAKVKVK